MLILVLFSCQQIYLYLWCVHWNTDSKLCKLAYTSYQVWREYLDFYELETKFLKEINCSCCQLLQYWYSQFIILRKDN